MEERPKRRRRNPDPNEPPTTGKARPRRPAGGPSAPSPQRKQAEAILQENEERFRRLFDQSPLGKALVAADFRFLRVNEAFCRITGYTAGEMLSLDFPAITHPEDLAADVEQARRLVAGEIDQYETEKRCVRKDGAILWVRLHARAIRDGEGNLLYFLPVVEDITARKKAEAALKAHEALLGTVLETLPVGVWVLDGDGRIVLGNEEARRIWGGARYVGIEEYGEYKGWWAGSGKRIEPEEWAAARAVARGETSLNEEIEIEGFDGSRRTILHSAVPIRDEGGNVTGAIVVNQDITERTRMEEALRRSHEELEERVGGRTRELVDLTEDLRAEVRQRRDAEEAARREQAFRETIEDSLVSGLVAVDKEGRILSVNDAFCAMTEWSKEELLGTAPPHGFWAPEEIKTIAAARKTLGKGSTLADQEFVLRRRSGKRFSALVCASPMRDPDGTVKGYVGSVTDITQRKRAEEEYRAILKTAMDGFWVSDNEGRFIDVNDAACRHLGYAREELLGGMRIQDIEAAESPEETAARIRKIREVGHDRFETRHRRRDGVVVDSEVSVNYTDTGGGRCFVFIRDTTERKEAERVARIQQKMASLGQVAAGVAHEIRNPLSGINICLHSLKKLLGEAEGLDPETRQSAEASIGIMQGASTKIEAVILRVLSFSRPGPARRAPLDVNVCIREAVDMARISLQKAGIRVSVALREDLPVCLGDMHLVAQALINLLTNAAQAMEGQETEKRIEVLSGVSDGHVTVSVADSGPGVPPHLRERLFDPFFTTKKEGTGIGLSLSHKIVSDHGGFLRVGEGRLGGALFTIGLPAGDERNLPAV